MRRSCLDQLAKASGLEIAGETTVRQCLGYLGRHLVLGDGAVCGEWAGVWVPFI